MILTIILLSVPETVETGKKKARTVGPLDDIELSHSSLKSWLAKKDHGGVKFFYPSTPLSSALSNVFPESGLCFFQNLYELYDSYC